MRKVCVITGSRADYGLLQPLMQKLKSHEAYDLQVIASAMHLSERHGNTYQAIEADGFHIDAKIPMLSDDNSPKGIVHSMGSGLGLFADELTSLKPDLVVILGDRFEALVAAQAAATLNIPIAHCHGGEVTQGAIDDSYRHAITKLSHLHFTSSEVYRNRVVQMGEQPSNCYTVGAMGLEAIHTTKVESMDEISIDLDFYLSHDYFLVTYHPVTLSNQPDTEALTELLDALDHFPDHNLVITYPNADAYGDELIKMLQTYADSQPKRVYLTPSLGQKGYINVAHHAKACVGNSSSGILEMPSIGIPTINIGSRQKGRLCADSVINCEPQSDKIIEALLTVTLTDMQTLAAQKQSPYGDGHVSKRIMDILDQTNFTQLSPKVFHDIKVSDD